MTADSKGLGKKHKVGEKKKAPTSSPGLKLYDMDDSDEEETEFVGGKKRRSRKTFGKKRKTETKKTDPTSERKRRKLNSDDFGYDDEDAEEFKQEHDENGYGDEEDRKLLMNMTEVKREIILDERVIDRRQSTNCGRRAVRCKPRNPRVSPE